MPRPYSTPVALKMSYSLKQRPFDGSAAKSQAFTAIWNTTRFVNDAKTLQAQAIKAKGQSASNP
jgi:hypothetical protein